MLKNKIVTLPFALIVAFSSKAQTLKLDAIIDSITVSHPVVKMYNNEIRSMDETAKGTRSWMPPEFSTGFWMVPYNPNLWKKNDMGATGMGQYMVGGQQMFPNKGKQNADAVYMQAMSAVEKEKKNAYDQISKGYEDNFVWNCENQGVKRPFRILQKVTITYIILIYITNINIIYIREEKLLTQKIFYRLRIPTLCIR